MTKEFGSFVTHIKENCTGCRACELACFAAHRTEGGRTVGTVTVPVTPKLFVDGTQVTQCKHCEDAPCRNACQRDAILRIDNQLLINTQKCQRCGAPVCASACPFGSIRLMPLPSKCDLCIGEEGSACVAACPNKALRLVRLEEERAEKNANALRWLKYMG